MTNEDLVVVRNDEEWQAFGAGLQPGASYRVALRGARVQALKTVIPACNLTLIGSDGAVIDGRLGQDILLAHAQAHITITNLTLLGGWRSAIAFGGQEAQDGYLDISDCTVIGSRDGGRTKWGAITHGQSVTVRECRFEGFEEHGLYLHNAQEVRVQKTRFARCGRTGLQSVARRHENGGQITGLVIVRDCEFIGTGDLDGGGAITLQGVAWAEIMSVIIRPADHGSGLVVWPEHAPPEKIGRRSGLVLLEDVRMETTGRPTMIVAGVDCLAVRDTRITRVPEHAVAVEIDDPSGGTAGQEFPTQTLVRGPDVRVVGRVVMGGQS